MIEILCTNSSCLTTFKFHEDKHPEAQKVMCPKCRSIQPLPSYGGNKNGQNHSLDDWFAPKEKAAAEQDSKLSSARAKPLEDEFDFFEDANPNKKLGNSGPSHNRQERRSIQDNPTEFGWLVVHDEFTKTDTFPLVEGVNRIGRCSQDADSSINISIVTSDAYMSRYHCELEVRRVNHKLEYIISDKSTRRKKQSTNGTYINASHRRLLPSEEVIIHDGDTIQLGATKLVLKTPVEVKNAAEAEMFVQQTDYSKTVIF
jgi:hypothetical protein